MKGINITTIFYPGLSFTDWELEELTMDLRDVASECFTDIPYYQALTGEREELERAVIALAKDDNGELLGFCSSLVFDVPNYGKVLHLGLTCVSPKARGKKLTHKLASKLLMQFLLKESLFGSVWVSNCACVLSSLGNVALYFENIYPSPYAKNRPSLDHLNIAKYISDHYREPIAINNEAVLNTKTFVFEGSVKDAVFEKDGNDARYFHRNRELTNFYKNIIDFERGDEVLQIGKVSMLTFPKYLWNTSKRKSSFLLQNVKEA